MCNGSGANRQMRTYLYRTQTGKIVPLNYQPTGDDKTRLQPYQLPDFEPTTLQHFIEDLLVPNKDKAVIKHLYSLTKHADEKTQFELRVKLAEKLELTLDELEKHKPTQKKEETPKVNFTGLRVDNFLDNVELLKKKQPLFYDKNGMFWFWNTTQYKWEIVDEVDIMISLEKHLEFNGQTVNSNIKNQYLESLKRVGRSSTPKEAPNKWVQFKNKAFSLESKNVYDITPHYFFTNPLPYDMGKESNTPTMDKLFKDWVGEKNVNTLYQLIAYCCTTTYPIHLIFCLVGTGRNGKTQFQKVLNKFMGLEFRAANLTLLIGV